MQGRVCPKKLHLESGHSRVRVVMRVSLLPSIQLILPINPTNHILFISKTYNIQNSSYTHVYSSFFKSIYQTPSYKTFREQIYSKLIHRIFLLKDKNKGFISKTNFKNFKLSPNTFANSIQSIHPNSLAFILGTHTCIRVHFVFLLGPSELDSMHSY